MKINHTSQLAKCLATEDITVVIDPSAPSAYFQVEDRVLGLPNWSNDNKSVHDLLVGHEVGHALFTPGGMEETLNRIDTENHDVIHSFINVIEDHRIDKMVKQKYPGLRKSFHNGYKSLMEKNLFGTEHPDTDISDYNLIDRINLQSKLGTFKDIPFSPTENTYMQMVDECKTFEDVIDAATELYKYAKAKSETDMHLNLPSGQGEGEGEGDGNLPQPSDQNKGDQQMESPDGDGTQESENGDTQKPINENGSDELTESTTQKRFHEHLRGDPDLRDRDMSGINAVIPSGINCEDYIIHYPKTLQVLREHYEGRSEEYKSKFKRFRSESSKTVNYMVKEFEMKRNAQQHARASISRTGVIDTNKLHSYQLSEDIFRKITNVPGGKNHGLVMFVDWSGSMSNDMGATIRQLLNLVMFCSKVNIPFEVYSFTDVECSNYSTTDTDKHFGLKSHDYKHNELMFNSFRLRNYFSSSMKKRQLEDAMFYMYIMSCKYDKYSYSWDLPLQDCLGGTPLNDAIMIAHDIIPKFKSANRIEKVNMVLLTDGESNGNIRINDSVSSEQDEVYISNYTNFNLHDPVTRQTYSIQERGEFTSGLLQSIRDRHDIEVVGFFIASGNIQRNLNMFGIPWNETREYRKKLNREKYLLLETSGYSEMYLLLGGKDLDIDNSNLEVKEGASKRVLTTAFKKLNKGKLSSRVVLTRFIDLIA